MLPRAGSPRATAIALAATLLLGMLLTLGTSRFEDRAAAARFDRLADLVAGNLQQRMTQHIALLRATRSYLEAEHGDITPRELELYVESLDLATNSPGIQGIGFAPLIDAGETPHFAEQLAAGHGVPIVVGPATDQPLRAPVAMLEPQDDRNQAALGFDMLSEPVRRAAILAAEQGLDPRATGPVRLVQEITADKQAGFVIFLRARTGLARMGGVRGESLVYAPFRAGDLHRAVLADLPALPLTIRTVDLGDPGTPLFDSQAENGAALAPPPQRAADAVLREFDVAGRRWQVTVTPTAAFRGIQDRSATLTVAALSALLLIAVRVAMGSIADSLAAARRTAELAERQAADRALMLREMQHRIKNHIARIQAMSRQSMRGAADMEEFQRIFGGRLNAMAKAQDALGREGRHQADLHALLRAELAQVQEVGAVEAALDGPAVDLGAKEAQAVGLVAHELVTNAMKYGGDTSADGSGVRDLRISWRIVQKAGKPWLDIGWEEPHARMAETTASVPGGFGTQLIEALVEGDLGGRFTRRFDSTGMHVTLGFPLHEHEARL